MKKTKLLILALLSFYLLSGCNQNEINNENNSESITEASSITTEETTISTTSETTIESTTTTIPTTIETTDTTVETLVDPSRDTIVRNVCWGDTIEIVKSLEEESIVEETNDALLYNTEISGYSSSLLYQFDSEHGLYQVSYNVDSTLVNNGTIAIGMYNKLVEALSTKYGEPSNKVEKELDSLYKYCDSDAQAIELGYLAYLTTWTFDNTEINIILAQVNYKYAPVIIMKDTSFEPPIDTSGF